MAAPQRSRNSREGSERSGDGERRDRRNGRGNDRDNRYGSDKDGYIERVTTINRVSKVVKGGRRFSFTALVAMDDSEGTVGVGYGKAREIPRAISKGVREAKKNFVHVPTTRRTITHLVEGRAAAGVVLLRLAALGTGIIAGGPVYTVLGTVDVHDVLTRSLGSVDTVGIVHAMINASKQLGQPEAVAAHRDLSFKCIAPVSMFRVRAGGEAGKRTTAE